VFIQQTAEEHFDSSDRLVYAKTRASK